MCITDISSGKLANLKTGNTGRDLLCLTSAHKFVF